MKLSCFLFVDQPSDTILSICLDPTGDVQAPLERRSKEEIYALQANAQTIIVLPTSFCSLHEVELPWLSAKKTLNAIPYALEDQVSQPLDSLHIAFSRHYYVSGRYLVAVIDQDLLTTWVSYFQKLEINFNAITLDWFALNQHEIIISHSEILLNTNEFKGSIDTNCLQLCPPMPILVFTDSKPISHTLISTQNMEDSVYIWIAKRLQANVLFDIFQGKFNKYGNKSLSKWWYWVVGGLFSTWILSFLFFNIMNNAILSNKLTQIDQKIALIYRAFFPEARFVTNPKFRISQLMSADLSQKNLLLWRYLDALGVAYQQDKFILQQLSFQNNVLSINLITPDFATLQRIEDKLKQIHINVIQKQAASHQDQVIAILEFKS